MIFSKAKWNSAGELKTFVPVSSAISFEKMEAPLTNALSMFIAPVIGDALVSKLNVIYNAENQADLDKKFLNLAQLAVANLAFYYDFDALNLRITDQGFQRQQSDSWQGTYKYQEDNLRNSFRNKGFNAIDDLLAFLEANAATYTDFQSSPGYTLRAKSIVQSTDEVNQVCFINNSRIIFMRMQALFNVIIENELQPVLGERLFAQLNKWLGGEEFKIEGTTFKEFRLHCARFVIMRAAARLIESTGSLTERGLYFTTISAGDGNMVHQPATGDQIAWRMQVYNTDSENYKTALIRFITLYMPDYAAGSSQHALDRDNNNHSTFFA